MRDDKIQPISRRTAAYFRNEQQLLDAVREVREAGFEIDDVYTPFPVHGLDAAMGLKRSRLTMVALLGGLFGLANGLFMQIWTSAYDWPLNVGGKPLNSMVLFVPVAFELTVLCSGLIVVGTFLWRSRLLPGKRRHVFPRSTDDRFVVVLREHDGMLDFAEAMRILERHGAGTIIEGAAS